MVLVGLMVRLVVVGFLYPEQLNPWRDHLLFGWETGRVARAIAAGEGFSSPFGEPSGPSALIPPVYPYLLAGVFKLFGTFSKTSALAILTLNSIFSALTCIPVYLASRASFGEKVAAWSGWMWAVFPYAVYFSGARVWNITLATLLFSLVFLMTLRLDRSSGLGAWVGYGLLWGVNALTNPVVLSSAPFLGGWLLYRLNKQGAKWRLLTAAYAAAFLLVIAPWWLRNYMTFHRVIPIRDNFWLEMHIGNSGDTSHVQPPSAHPLTSRMELEQFRSLGEIGYMDAKKREQVQRIVSHPAEFLWLSVRRVVFIWTGFWSLSPQFLAAEPLQVENILFASATSLLMLWGMRTALLSREMKAVPYGLVILSYPLVYYLSHPSIDYRHPIDPQIIVLSAYAVTHWVGRRKQVSGRIKLSDQSPCQISS